jgi:hypothetical protein
MQRRSTSSTCLVLGAAGDGVEGVHRGKKVGRDEARSLGRVSDENSHTGRKGRRGKDKEENGREDDLVDELVECMLAVGAWLAPDDRTG